jgi:hypothetical protein
MNLKTGLLLLIVLITTVAQADEVNCRASKSLAIYDPETGKRSVRKATTSSFAISQEEHDDSVELLFIEANGSNWGSVFVMTGRPTLNDGSKRLSVTASVKSEDGKTTLAYLSLALDLDARSGSALTMIDEPGTEFDPTLTIECSLTPL